PSCSNSRGDMRRAPSSPGGRGRSVTTARPYGCITGSHLISVGIPADCTPEYVSGGRFVLARAFPGARDEGRPRAIVYGRTGSEGRRPAWTWTCALRA